MRTIDALESRIVLTTAYAQFGFGVIASNLDFGQPTFFGSPDPFDRPYSEINFGQVEFYSLSGIDIGAAGVASVGDLQIMFGSMNTSDPPVLTLESFDDGLGDGIANQIFTHSGSGGENAVTLLNDGVPVAEGTLNRLEVETTPALVSTAFGSITFTAAVGVDTSVFDEIMNVTGDTGNFNFDTGEFDTDGTIVFDVDGSLFLSTGVGVYGELADLESLDYVPIDLDEGGDLNIRPTSAAQGDLTLGIDGNGNVVLSDSNGVLDDQVLDYNLVTGSLEVNGTGGDDTLTLDFTNGSPLPAGGLTFDGFGQTGMGEGDTIELLGGRVVSVVHQFDNASDGSIDVDGGMIAYTGLEPIIDNLDADNRVFTFGSGDDEITLSDDDSASNGISRLASAGSSETVDFANPRNRLTIVAGDGNDDVQLTAADVLYAATTVVQLGAGNDSLNGSGLSTRIVGVGNGGNDVMTGGEGNDVLRGGSGRDVLAGGAGNDRVFGQGSTGDQVSGGDGDDLIDGGAGNDRLFEQADVDFLLTASSLSGLGNDRLVGVERALLKGGAADNRIDASAFQGRVILVGFGGDDTLAGGAGNDVLRGGGGGDVLFAGPGNDRVFGQGGSGDKIYGGPGMDTINSGAGPDRIFTDGMDSIVMDALDTIVGLGT
ncbi:MAG: calcium-binding protein [Planctomycetota bacterium]